MWYIESKEGGDRNEDPVYQSALDAYIRENLKKVQTEITLAPGNPGAAKIIDDYYHRGTYVQ